MDFAIVNGPWPSQGSGNFTYRAAKGGITEIILRHGWVIDAIGFVVDDGSGKTETVKFGGDRGGETKIKINWPKEYLTTISGTIGVYYGSRVTSLSFHTNEKTYGPFGTSKDGDHGIKITSAFSSPTEGGGSIIGFYGRASNYIETVGIYRTSTLFTQTVSSIKIGPWPNESIEGSENWTFNAEKGGIKEIIVRTGWLIDSIAFVVDDGKGNTETLTFGGNGGDETKIKFDWPKEYLTSISGTIGEFNGTRITSLTFQTTDRTYGPFGTSKNEEINEVTIISPFSVPIQDGEIVGFHGSAGQQIDTVGIYVKPTKASN